MAKRDREETAGLRKRQRLKGLPQLDDPTAKSGEEDEPGQSLLHREAIEGPLTTLSESGEAVLAAHSLKNQRETEEGDSPALKRRAVENRDEILSPALRDTETEEPQPSPTPPEVPEPTPLSFMLWNIENFTNEDRPNRRRMGDVRLQILADTLDKHAIELAIILETGRDTKPQLEGSPLFVEYAVLDTAATGRNEETYIVLHKDVVSIEGELGLVGNPAGNEGRFRQACFFEAQKDDIPFSVCGLHAPSPGHNIRERRQVISRCASAASETANHPLIFCGDFNIRNGEQNQLIDLLESDPPNLSFLTPGARGLPEKTSVRKTRGSIFRQDLSEPYDQIWCQGPIEATNTSTLEAPDFSSQDPQNDLHTFVADRIGANRPNPRDANAVLGDAQRLPRRFDEERAAALKEEATQDLNALRRPEQDSEQDQELNNAIESINESDRDRILMLLSQIAVVADFNYSMNTQTNIGQALLREYLDDIQFTLLLSDTLSNVDRNAAVVSIATRLLISDHLPVVTTLQIPAS